MTLIYVLLGTLSVAAVVMTARRVLLFKAVRVDRRIPLIGGGDRLRERRRDDEVGGED
jgi:hypothetical protein